MTLRPKALALSVVFALPLAAQTGSKTIPDPANLMGERVSPQSPADTLAINHGAPALQQLLLKLRTRASLMMIVAHPDDEDGGMLTFESRGQGARVAMLTLTRGEGGQNLMTADFNDALGLIRTQELLAEDRYTGTDQFFGTEVDFGFSKTKEEAFQQWTHQRVLYDAVRAVRLYRPLVLASVFVGGVTDGHGHHQVSGEITQEVFLAAADPRVFPEMGLPPWAPLKVYARVPFSRVTPQGMYDYATGKYSPPLFHNYVTGQDITHEPTATVQIHEGDPATVTFPNHPATPTLGMEGLSYVQFARKGLALQKTQIGSNVRLAPPGRSDTGYTLMASRLACSQATANGCPILDAASSRQGGVSGSSPTALPSQEQSLFSGIDTSVRGLANLAPDASPAIKVVLKVHLGNLDRAIDEAQAQFDPANVGKIAPALLDAYKTTEFLIGQVESFKREYIPADQQFNLLHELRIKRVQLNSALVLANGLTLSATLSSTGPDQHVLTTQTHLVASASITNTSSIPATLASVSFLPLSDPESGDRLPHSGARHLLAPGATRQDKISAHIDPGLPATQPYFSRADIQQPFYSISDPALRNAPATPALTATAIFDDQGTELELITNILDPSHPSQTASVVPPLSIGITPSLGVVSIHAQTPFPFSINIRTNTLALTQPRIDLDDGGFQIKTPSDEFTLASTAQVHSMNATLTAPGIQDGSGLTGPPRVKAFAVVPKDGDISNGYRTVGYPGLTLTNLYTPATLRIVGVDVTVAPNLRIAYLPGTGDSIPTYLPNLGITPTILTLSDLTPTKLSQFDAILVGVRAYAAHPELAGPGSKPLLDYAAAGGVVILQYMTARYGDTEAPYPISVPGDPAHNVVVESQPVHILAPYSPLLTWPNALAPSDFTHWAEEWGHGFAATWSPQYTPLLEVNDPGQDPQQGGLLLARTGKGAYIYCAFALYRQLPEGVPGAYRLLANLLSYSKNPSR